MKAPRAPDLVATIALVSPVLLVLMALLALPLVVSAQESPPAVAVQAFSLVPGEPTPDPNGGCAAFLADLVRRGYVVTHVTSLTGPPGVLYTLLLNRGTNSMLALVKCGAHGGSDGGCGGGSGGGSGGCGE